MAVRVPRPSFTGTMAEAAGVRFAVEEIEREYEERAPRRRSALPGPTSATKGGW